MCSESSSLAPTLIGASIALVASIATTILAHRYSWRRQTKDRLIEAYVAWSTAFEDTLSHHSNFKNLQLQPPPTTADVDLQTRYRDDVSRVSIACGDAGRRFDASRYRLLLLETRAWAREEVTRITEETMARDLGNKTEADHRLFLSRIPRWQDELMKFLQRLASDDLPS